MSDHGPVKIVCPKCDALIATVPDGRSLNRDGLICSNCGAELRSSTQIERMTDKIKGALRRAEGAKSGKR